MSYDSDLNTPMIAVGGVIFVLGIFAVIIGTQAFFFNIKDTEVKKKVYEQLPEELAKHRIEQEGKLRNYSWVDKGKGVVSIPIERAMKMTAARLESERLGAETDDAK